MALFIATQIIYLYLHYSAIIVYLDVNEAELYIRTKSLSSQNPQYAIEVLDRHLPMK